MTFQRPTTEQLVMMRGRPVYAADGDKIGNVDEIFYDDTTGNPEWIGIGTGFFGTKTVVVPVEGMQLQNGGNESIHVPYSKDQVKDTPNIESDIISEETERQLYAHYGLMMPEASNEMRYTEGQVTGERDVVIEEERPAITEEGERTTFAGNEEASVSRYEEELHVGKRETDRGRVRLRKWVETEPATAEVELHQETACVEREPVDRPAPGAELGEEEAEMRLHGEEPVVSKETREKERIRLEREEESRRETVQGETRREHVEVEEEDRHDRR